MRPFFSSFTANHIARLWSLVPQICYPPVSLDTFRGLESSAERLLRDEQTINIASLSQFRPEKNHRAQLETLAALRAAGRVRTKLFLIGGVRNAEDERLVEDLRAFAKERKLREDVDFVLATNIAIDEIKELLKASNFRSLLSGSFARLELHVCASHDDRRAFRYCDRRADGSRPDYDCAQLR